MSVAELNQTRLPTTILMVDDEEPVLKRLVMESQDFTHLGVVVAANLREAVKFFQSELPIDALLVDLNFREETQCPEENLVDGLDFISYAQKKRADIPTFVITMEGEDLGRKAQAQNKMLSIRNWFDKLSANQPGGLTVLEQIERQLIVDALKNNKDIRNRARESGVSDDRWVDDDVVDAVRTVLDYPRTTFLQRMPLGTELEIKKPIEVVCRNVDGKYLAYARRIPMLTEAESADTPSEAIANLAEHLEAEKKAMEGQQLVGYGAHIQKVLDEYLASKT